MPNSKLTLLVDGNWLLMSRLSVLQNRYQTDEQLCKDLKLMLIRSLSIVLNQFTEIDNIIFISDGGSWRNKVEIPSFLEEEYKGNREKDENIDWDLVFEAFEDLQNKLRSKGITVCKEYNLEGDDWMWYWSEKLNSEGTNCMIWSRDKDLTQLIKINKDCCFTVCWCKDSGLITIHRDEDSMDFFFNEAYSENEQIYHSIIDKAKDVKEINPKEIVVDKIVRGDKGDNILPIILKQSKTKAFRVSQKDIDPNLNYNSKEDVKRYITNLLNQKSYKDKVNKPLENILEHFEYNKKLIALEKESYPPDVLEIFDNYKTYNLSKDIREVEYELNAEASSISSMLELV